MTNLKIFQQFPFLLTQLNEIEQLFQQLLDLSGLSSHMLEIDHISLRVNTQETAQCWQQCIAEEAMLLSDSEINGRPIYLYELRQPLSVLGQAVSVVELPFPTEKKYPREGWEHIEMVLPLLPKETIEQWFDRAEQLLKLTNERIIVKKSCHKAVGDSLPNPTVAIKLAGDTNTVTIKLHPYAIKQVVMSENQSI